MKRLFTKKLLLYFILSILVFIGCRKQDQLAPLERDFALSSNERTNSENESLRYDSYVVQSWYNLMLRLITETPGHTPPIAARSFAYTGVALYEALVGQTPQYHSLTGQLNALSFIPKRMYGNSYSLPVTANAALARIIKLLFQNASTISKQRIDSLEAAVETMYTIPRAETIINRSREYGRSVADAVFNWSKTDGGHEGYLKNFPTDFTAPSGVDSWVPTPPLYQLAMLPYWGNNRPMLSTNGAGSVDPPAPIAFSFLQNSAFYQAAREVYQTGLQLTDEQKTIALYWNDGAASFTPPGHNIAITLQLIRNRNLSLNQAAILLAKIGIALNDAAIVCWRAKYKWNLLRPVSFIRSYIDPAWSPLISTPPFPSYTSGHSTFSSSVATVLTSELGNNISFTDSTKMADGFSPRSFPNLNAYAQEAAVSRLYGGIHYAFDNEKGFSCGQQIAMNIERLQW